MNKPISIYLVTNKIDGKVYVGQTSGPVIKRWRNHLSCAKIGEDHYMYRAMRKHGSANFSIQEIAVTKNQISANNLERLWITVLRASDNKYGYNGSLGGDGHFCQNEETRQKKSAKLRAGFKNGRVNWSFRPEISSQKIIELYQQGYSHRQIGKLLGCGQSTVKSRLKKSNIQCRPIGEHTGYKHSDDTKKRMSEIKFLKTVAWG